MSVQNIFVAVDFEILKNIYATHVDSANIASNKNKNYSLTFKKYLTTRTRYHYTYRFWGIYCCLLPEEHPKKLWIGKRFSSSSLELKTKLRMKKNLFNIMKLTDSFGVFDYQKVKYGCLLTYVVKRKI